MITPKKSRKIIPVLGLITAMTSVSATQQPSVAIQDPFQQHVPGVALKEQDVIDGVAMLGLRTGLAVSVEHQLGASISGPAPKPITLTRTVAPGTASEVLDALCSLDPTFVWVRNGNMVNVLPRALAGDPNYLLNRTIQELVLKDVPGAQEAVFEVAAGLAGPKEQIAIMQVGTPIGFAQPWSVTLRNVTVREVFDLIAEKLGPAYGWQFTGAQDFRIITFHQGLLPNAAHGKGD